MPDARIDPNQTALLIQDMQNELIKGGAMPVQPYTGEEIIANSVRAAGKGARRWDGGDLRGGEPPARPQGCAASTIWSAGQRG